MLELRVADTTAQVTGDAVQVRDVTEDLAARGRGAAGEGNVYGAQTANGDRQEVLITPLREAGRRPTPAERHREAVRRFWIAETLAP